MHLRCLHCGGVIDPDTLTCLMCARQHLWKLARPEDKRKQLVLQSRQYDRIFSTVNGGTPKLPGQRKI